MGLGNSLPDNLFGHASTRRSLQQLSQYTIGQIIMDAIRADEDAIAGQNIYLPEVGCQRFLMTKRLGDTIAVVEVASLHIVKLCSRYRLIDTQSILWRN